MKPAEILRDIKKLPKKLLGQNFLVDESVVRDMISAAEIIVSSKGSGLVETICGWSVAEVFGEGCNSCAGFNFLLAIFLRIISNGATVYTTT